MKAVCREVSICILRVICLNIVFLSFFEGVFCAAGGLLRVESAPGKYKERVVFLLTPKVSMYSTGVLVLRPKMEPYKFLKAPGLLIVWYLCVVLYPSAERNLKIESTIVCIGRPS